MKTSTLLPLELRRAQVRRTGRTCRRHPLRIALDRARAMRRRNESFPFWPSLGSVACTAIVTLSFVMGLWASN